MQKVKSAVIGVGYLGRFHAQKYHQLENAELIAVCDANIENARKVAEELGVEAVTDYRELVGKVDAVSIVVPTQLHFEVAKAFLDVGTHVMLEKPITVTVEQAQILVDIAKEKDVIFQVGHLERFNPAILALDSSLTQSLFIESHRVAPFNPRGADVSVILDLMIHDIDIILDIVNSPVTHISAKGVAVLSNDIDIANARLEFENGCVANVTASRAGMKSERKMRLFQHDAYISIDFQNKTLGIHRKGSGEMFPGVANIESDEQAFAQGDALLSEIESFLNCIQTRQPPVVSGEDGKRALETAMEITRLLSESKP